MNKFEKEQSIIRKLVREHVSTWSVRTHTDWDMWGKPTEDKIINAVVNMLNKNTKDL